MKKGKALIFSAPSGAGKTTIVRHLVNKIPDLSFSISATTREKREEEEEGRDYYFLSEQSFKSKIEKEEFLEWEQVYEGLYYGTLKSELERIWSQGNQPIFDVDVQGGIHLKALLGSGAKAVFVKVSDIEVLRERLKNRNSESAESLEKRVAKAVHEMRFECHFDHSLVNDDMGQAFREAESLARAFLKT